MILVVGGTRGGGKVCAELLTSKGHEVEAIGRADPLPTSLPQAIAFYQRDREDEFGAGVEKTRDVVRQYVENGLRDAQIVLIGSTAIRQDDGSPGAYRIAKTAMLALMRKYAETLQECGISVNMVSPGNFRTGEMEALDVAEVVAFFLSPKARFITGQEIVVRAP